MADNGIVIKKYAPESGAIVIMSREGTGDDEAVGVFREYARNFGGTVFAGGNAGTLDQVKHIIYAGCERVVFDVSRPGDLEELPEADVKFGSSRLCAYVPDGFTGRDQIFRASEHAELFLVDNEEMAEFVNDISGMDCEILTDVPEDAAADDTLTEGSSDAPAEEKPVKKFGISPLLKRLGKNLLMSPKRITIPEKQQNLRRMSLQVKP
ncbi:MAG: hypothetical protein IJT00_10865 [Lachnospiraceae bacterium]|nr:hypothetical protein [Lachnospiraceae bacterium]